MDLVDLPLIGANARLTDAIEAMGRTMRSGVVLDLPGDPRVLAVDVVLDALHNEGDLEAGAIDPRLNAMRLPAELAADDVFLTDRRLSDVEALLDGNEVAYAVVRTLGDSAQVLTRHEYYGGILNQPPSVWRCRNQPAHYWQAPDLLPGNRCRVDGTVVDLMV